MHKRVRITLIVTAVVLVGLLIMGMQRKAQPVVTVLGAEVVKQDIFNSIYTPGQVEAVKTSAFTVAQSATVTKIYVNTGDTVKVGQRLAQICPSAPAVTEESLDMYAEQVFAGETVDTNAISKALQESTQGEAYDIVADINGVVLQVPDAEGQNLLPGTVYLKIADLSKLQVRVDIPENYAGEVQAGQAANVTCTALTQETLGAQVESIAPFARRSVSFTGRKTTATVAAVLSLDHAGSLKPGYSTEVRIFTGEEKNAVLVPYEAVCQTDSGSEYVFVAKDGVAHRKWVTSGRQLEGYLQIKNGVTVNDMVLCSPPEGLQDGDRVEVTGV